MPKTDKTEAAKNALIAAAQAYYDAVAEDTKDQLAKVLETNPHEAKVVIAQNVIRLTMEATLNKMVPFPEVTCLTLAMRLASYALSVAPMDRQPAITGAFMASFPYNHAERLKKGVMIHTGWAGEGDVPEGVTKQ